MARYKDSISNYGEEFINSITLSNIKSINELKLLYQKLEDANEVMTEFYRVLFTDYITAINKSSDPACIVPDLATVKKYKSIASRIHKAYFYIQYLLTFENPFLKDV
jgi:hypothetical protein